MTTDERGGNVMSIATHNWLPVNERQRRWHFASWNGTYSVFETSPGRWRIDFGDEWLASAMSFAAAVAFAEWHDDFRGGRYDN